MPCWIVATTLLGLAAVPAGCAKRRVPDEQREASVPGQPIAVVLSRHNDALLSIPGVVGTGIGDCGGKPCIKVFVQRKTPALVQRIPAALEGFPVAVEETGEIRALDST